MAAVVDLDKMIENALKAVAEPDGGPAHADTTMRERFFEFMVLILGNLYTKTPLASTLFDRTIMLRLTTGMDDNDAGKLTGRTEDWMRLENLVRQQDGAKAYFLTKQTLAALSVVTPSGTLGEVFDQILKRYVSGMPSEELRRATRVLGSYFISVV